MFMKRKTKAQFDRAELIEKLRSELAHDDMNAFIRLFGGDDEHSEDMDEISERHLEHLKSQISEFDLITPTMNFNMQTGVSGKITVALENFNMHFVYSEMFFNKRIFYHVN